MSGSRDNALVRVGRSLVARFLVLLVVQPTITTTTTTVFVHGAALQLGSSGSLFVADHGTGNDDGYVLKFDVSMDTSTSQESVAAGTIFLPNAGLTSPHHMGYQATDNYMYISYGTSASNSGILRYHVKQDTFNKTFITSSTATADGGILIRPTGFAFYPEEDTIYVASYGSDQILMYSLTTGEYQGIFAAGNGTAAGLLNGPAQLVIQSDERDATLNYLLVTTTGSVADATKGTIQEGVFDSQVIQYSLTKSTPGASAAAKKKSQGEIIIYLPDPLENRTATSTAFYGIVVGCGDSSSALSVDDCTIFTTDRHGVLRSHEFVSKNDIFERDVIAAYLGDSVAASIINGTVTTGGLYEKQGLLYFPSFYGTNTSNSVVQRYSARTGLPKGLELPADVDPDQENTIFIQNNPNQTASSSSPILRQPVDIFLLEAKDIDTLKVTPSPTRAPSPSAFQPKPTSAAPPAFAPIVLRERKDWYFQALQQAVGWMVTVIASFAGWVALF